MTDRPKAERREFKDALSENWKRKKDELFPDGPRTRDDKYVAGAITLARVADTDAILGRSGDYPPQLMTTWLGWHKDWVDAEFPRVVAEAIAKLRQMRTDDLAERRRKRKNVWRNGRRTKANKPGPRPSRKLNLTCKLVSAKRA